MRTLPKHLRPRRRYLGVRLDSWPDARIDRRAFQGALWRSARRLLGDPGSADCDPTVVRFRFADGYGETIVRVRREKRTQGRAAIACIAQIDGHPVGLRVWGTSGTIRGCIAQKTAENGSIEANGNEPTGTERTSGFEGVDRRTVRRPETGVDIEGENGWIGATTRDIETETPDRTEPGE